MTSAPFSSRHIGLSDEDIKKMLAVIGESTVDDLINKTIPSSIRLKEKLKLEAPLSEYQYIQHLKKLAQKNRVFRSYIGQGYYNTKVPAVIQRNILENPGWYTAYTPYQAEIAQGRLEALLNFQTMVCDLTGMEIANASLLDEGTAAAEAMILMYNARSRQAKKDGVSRFFVDENCFIQTIDVLKTRSEPLGIELVIGKFSEFDFDKSFFGSLLQYPDKIGEVHDYKGFVEQAHEMEILVGVAADLLSLAILVPPGEWGADFVFGTTQRFGIPLGYGGPHAAYFATHEHYKRNMPGRIIGLSVDADNQPALRMALQTREQHIKRDKATSNICTAQVLLAVMAGMYAVYHGKEGIRQIASGIHSYTNALKMALLNYGYQVLTVNFFDTLSLKMSTQEADKLVDFLAQNEINVFRANKDIISISLNETVEWHELVALMELLASFKEQTSERFDNVNMGFFNDSRFERTSSFLDHEVFNKYHSETEMMRYIKRLENKDFSLVHGMIPLGSCTMKLNAATQLLPLTWPEFANIHPFAPANQTEGYQSMLSDLEKDLSKITGFYKTSLQPNSGAQGEYAGLMVIRAYHKANGDHQRDVALIPSSAHGTNPASAVMAGMRVVVVKCDEQGNIDFDDLREKVEQYTNELAALMITYPSTHGVYEESVKEITHLIHEHGGQVYMDGANMNAQVGLTNPANIGADVCHLNLHKTFAIPHGGGGPGMGPIGVVEHLAPFLPGNPLASVGGENAITAISAAPYGSALVLLISYAYIKMLGEEGLTASTKAAILSANYLKVKLQEKYDVLYQGKNNTVAHEMILDCRNYKSTSGVEVVDIAKRLMDYGFHAPTVSFPVNGTLMIEPTESESLEELDRFIEAMSAIRDEIKEVEVDPYLRENNILKNAPHTQAMALTDNWKMSYSRQRAVYPIESIKQNKFWPSVRRVDDAYGDRNLICSCSPIEDYAI